MYMYTQLLEPDNICHMVAERGRTIQANVHTAMNNLNIFQEEQRESEITLHGPVK